MKLLTDHISMCGGVGIIIEKEAFELAFTDELFIASEQSNEASKTGFSILSAQTKRLTRKDQDRWRNWLGCKVCPQEMMPEVKILKSREAWRKSALFLLLWVNCSMILSSESTKIS